MAAVYSATKHALAAITIGLRQELQAFGIRVSEVSPGMVDTKYAPPSNTPLCGGTQGADLCCFDADEVAAAVVFAATAPHNVVTGLIDVRPLGSL